ncbi:hypothetical protein SKAU_G00182930 [Synaphobranchus kaupii]|uniref:Uncharacterized protein n=1 Tax=Synaphobranchus kaupii TaxID=118154 RepID=A0A9Q1FC38_SYNKA|nr:hypothetical protein SKAU_G00182930 [Synaphobranchus kaupii]
MLSGRGRGPSALWQFRSLHATLGQWGSGYLTAPGRRASWPLQHGVGHEKELCGRKPGREPGASPRHVLNTAGSECASEPSELSRAAQREGAELPPASPRARSRPSFCQATAELS